MSVPKEELERLKKSQAKMQGKETPRQQELPPEAMNCPYPTREEDEEAPMEGPRPELLPAKKEDAQFEVAGVYGVPRWAVMMFGTPGNMHPFVTAEGLSIKTDKKKPNAIQTDDYKEIPDGYQVTARIFPMLTTLQLEMIKAATGLAPDVQKMVLSNVIVPWTAIGTATKKNCKNERMWPYLLELAQTRAANRAKRQFTAMGLTSIEEMPDYEGEEAGDK